MGAKFEDYDSLAFRKYTSKSEFDKAVHTLEGILKGIVIDSQVNSKELNELKAWCSFYKHYSYYHPFSELIPLIEKNIADDLLDDDEVKDILWLCNQFKTKNLFFDLVTADMQRLQGMLHGILSDNEINLEEVQSLKKWLDENKHLSKAYPYDEIYSLVILALVDGRLSDSEKNILRVFFGEFVDANVSKNIDVDELLKLKKEITLNGICAICPDIEVENRIFCFTGISSRTTRKAFADTIESVGGIYYNSVSRKTNYLVVGNEGNPCWAFSCYGRKVETAVNLRKNGHGILIVHENDLWDSLEDFVCNRS